MRVSLAGLTGSTLPDPPFQPILPPAGNPHPEP
jgi:hypothetical protein